MIRRQPDYALANIVWNAVPDAIWLGRSVVQGLTEPARLVTLLPGILDEQGRRFANIYNRVADRLIDQRPLHRLPLIHMTAQMEAPDLAPLLEPPVPGRWRCRWAQVQPSTPHRIIGRHSHSVNAVALGEIDGRAVIVSGSDHETVQIWDARTGYPIGLPFIGGPGKVKAVALGAVDGRAVVVSGSSDGTIRLWDAQRGDPIGQPLAGHTKGVTSVALGELDGRRVVVSGSDDGTIRLWEAPTVEPIAQPRPKRMDVRAVALGEADGRAVVVSVGKQGSCC